MNESSAVDRGNLVVIDTAFDQLVELSTWLSLTYSTRSSEVNNFVVTMQKL